jgi:uncharacterized protein YkwD
VTSRRLIALLALSALLSAPAALAQRTAARTTDVQAIDAGVLAQLNAIRTSHGLVPLKLNAALTAAALGHSSEMLADGYFAHDSFDGAPFWKRLGRYAQSRTWSAGENLLWSAGALDGAKALQIWMASPEHRDNILRPGWREIGIAAVYASSADGVYGGSPATVITTDFGSRG